MNDPERDALEKRIAELERELTEQKRTAELLYLEKEKFYRFLNEFPTLLMIGIVILVVVKPF